MSLTRKTANAAAVVMAAGALLGAATHVHAQEHARVVVNMADGVPGGSGAISKRSVERYSELLGFSGDQKETAITFHEGYLASYKDVQKAKSTAIADLNRSAQDSGDHSVFMEKFPAINKEFRDKSVKLEKSFLDDLKALCADTAQEGRWAKIERMRRRETELRRGAVAGEAMDLVEIVSNLKLPPEGVAAVAASLDEYELEIDAQIKARIQAAADSPGFEPGKPNDMEAIQKAMANSRDVGLKIKGVNDRFARRIEAALPEVNQQAFRNAVRQATYPQVYRRSPIVRDIDKALALTDLSAEQRTTLTQLKSGYERDAKPANEAWASAIDAADKTEAGGGAMPGPGGGMVMVRMNDEPEPLKQARKARRDLDDKTRSTLTKTLNESQQEAIKPRPGEGEEGFEVAGEAIMIRTTR